MKWRKSLCDTIYTTIQAVYVFATTVVLIRATFVAPDYLYYKEYNEYRKETILRWSNVEKGAMPYEETNNMSMGEEHIYNVTFPTAYGFQFRNHCHSLFSSSLLFS